MLGKKRYSGFNYHSGWFAIKENNIDDRIPGLRNGRMEDETGPSSTHWTISLRWGELLLKLKLLVLTSIQINQSS